MEKMGVDEHQDLRAQLQHRAVPAEVIDGLIKYHTPVTYGPDSLVFRQDSAADILFWVVKGMVRIYYPQPDGSRILVHLASPGDVLGGVDGLDEHGQWTRRLEAQTMTKCVLAMVTRQQILKLVSEIEQSTLIEVLQRMNAMWSSWLVHYVNFLGLSCRERIELVLRQIARRFGVKDKEGILLTFTPLHSDLAEMIGSSRPMVSRLIAMMVEEGVLARRGKQYVLLNDGGLTGRVTKLSARPLAQPINGSSERKIRIKPAALAKPLRSRLHDLRE